MHHQIVNFLKRYGNYVSLVLLSGIVYFSSYSGPSFDIWYHLKLGQVFLQKGLFFHDIFSFSAYGRPFIPYEWLFQILVYLFKQTFGLSSLGILVALLSTVQIAFFYFLLRKIFSLHWINSFLLSIFYYAVISPYLVQRPTVVANLFFLVFLFLIFVFIYKQKNYLWLTTALMIIWSNLHASFVLGIVFTVLFGTICFLLSFFLEEKSSWQRKGIFLLGYAALFIAISFLPPLHGQQYRTFLLYWTYRNNLASIVEWRPLYYSGISIFWFYSLTVILTGILFFFSKRKWQDIILLSPMILLIFAPYFADRNLLYGIFGVVIVLGFSLVMPNAQSAKKETVRYLMKSVTVGILCLSYILYFTPFSTSPQSIHFPDQAASFILSQHISGNMFNDYNYGGYLLYRLYPQQKVFIDGRGDMYLCCEFPRFNTLSRLDLQNNESEFIKEFNRLVYDYRISFVLTTLSEEMDKRIAKMLSTDPHWTLVFWNDYSQIFVRKDGKNTKLIQNFAVTAATPYGTSPYDPNRIQKAKEEYMRMISVADSAISRNSLGLIDMREKNLAQAMIEFLRATQLNDNYLPPFVNLALLDIQQKRYTDAKPLFIRAIAIDPKNPLPYIYLGEIYAKIDQDITQAKSIWQQGLENVTDSSAQTQLQQLLNSY